MSFNLLTYGSIRMCWNAANRSWWRISAVPLSVGPPVNCSRTIRFLVHRVAPASPVVENVVSVAIITES